MNFYGIQQGNCKIGPMTAGYSQRSLLEKLGIKPGFEICITGAPANYEQTLGALPENVITRKRLKKNLDFIQFFVTDKIQLIDRFPTLKANMKKDGMLWISWPKKSSGVPSNVNENIIREVGLENGLVDIKVCAVDETWSGLKFVFRKSDRSKQ